MKKIALAGLISFLSAQVFASPAQVTFDAYTGSAQFYELGTYASGERAVDGWYAEIILQNGSAAYDGGSFASYSIAGENYGSYSPGFTTHMLGYRASGTAISTVTTRDGKSEIVWQFTETAINGYYATWRVYNAAAKKDATKYLVLGWRQIGVTPSPTFTSEIISWTTTDTRAQMTYDASAVPEPTAMALFGLSGLALVLRRKMRKDA